jgi:hypothetical protein
MTAISPVTNVAGQKLRQGNGMDLPASPLPVSGVAGSGICPARLQPPRYNIVPRGAAWSNGWLNALPCKPPTLQLQ